MGKTFQNTDGGGYNRNQIKAFFVDKVSVAMCLLVYVDTHICDYNMRRDGRT